MRPRRDASSHEKPGSEDAAGGSRARTERRLLRVIIADGNRLIVGGIRRALEGDDEIEIVGEAYTGPELLPLVARTAPDVVLLDLNMPKLDGLRCLALVRARSPLVKVVMLAAHAEPDDVRGALARGASGYIVTSINPRDIPSALRQAVEGSVYHAFDSSTVARSSARAVGLTERELTILRAVARGLSNQAIAQELWVTEQTVKFHLTNIYRKLGVSNRTEAARYAYAHRLASAESEPEPPDR